MKSSKRRFFRFAFGIYLAVVHAALLFLLAERFLHLSVFFPPLQASVADPLPEEPVPTPLPIPSILSDISSPTPAVHANLPVASGKLLIPVVGVTREQLTDTFSTARSEARVHQAIDIAARGGTPVVAVADGKIVKFWDSDHGGITIYQLSADERYFFYYAHLQSRAPEIKEGDTVRQGATIGFVGDTGNAGAGNFHLHFGVSIVIDPKRYWDGQSINPYPLLTQP
ncbi:MAG: M23 family metallopeptidase [Acidobacteria bacterium]|nr:M23 family metallopeptidase [Acidobacteriota bacterium]MCA1609136.1 M23 family metallopeptidase [Acidobacteriota bacterium]